MLEYVTTASSLHLVRKAFLIYVSSFSLTSFMIIKFQGHMELQHIKLTWDIFSTSCLTPYYLLQELLLSRICFLLAACAVFFIPFPSSQVEILPFVFSSDLRLAADMGSRKWYFGFPSPHHPRWTGL